MKKRYGIILYLGLFLTGLCFAESAPILELDTKGHQGAVKKVLVTPNKKKLITISEDKTIRIWDIKKGLQERKIIGQIAAGSGGKYFTAALSPNGHWLAAAGYLANYNGKNRKEIGAIRIFDFKTGKMKYLLKGHQDAVFDLKFNASGNKLVSGSGDGAVMVWNVADHFNKIRTLKGHKGHVQAVGFSPNDLVLSAGTDKQVILWKGNKVRARYRHTTPFNYMAISEDHIALSGYDTAEIMILNHQLKKVRRIKTKSKPTGLAYSPNGRWLVTGTDNDSTDPQYFKPALYDAMDDYRLVTTFNRHDSVVLAVNFINNQQVISVGGNNQEIWLWDTQGKPIKSITGAGKSIWAVGIDGNTIAWGKQWKNETSENNNPLEQGFNIQKQQFYKTLKKTHQFKRLPIKFKNIYLSHKAGGEYGFPDAVLTIERGRLIKKEIVRSGKNGYGHNVYGFTDKGFIISGGGNGVLTAYRKNGRKIASLVGHTGEVWSLAAEKNWLVSGGADQVLRLWDLNQLEEGKIKIKPVLNLFVDQKNEWVLWNQQGYYAASPKGDQYVGFHLNRGEAKEAHFVTAQQLKKTLYRPDQVKLALKIVPPPPPPPVVIAGKPPEFKIVSPKANILVKDLKVQLVVEVKKTKHPVLGYRLFVNGNQVGNLPSRGLKRTKKGVATKYFSLALKPGTNDIKIEAHNDIGKTTKKIRINAPKPVKVAAKILKKGEPPYFRLISPKADSHVNQLKIQLGIEVRKDKNPVLGYALYVNGNQVSNPKTRGLIRRKKEMHTKYFNLHLKSGKNTIKIIAYNNIGKTIKEFSLFAPPPKKPVDERGKLYLIAIGVDDYPHLDANLNYAGADAKSFFDVALKRTKNMFKSKETIILTNKVGNKPNKRNVERALKLFNRATPKDTVVLFIAGHGINMGKEYYFLPTDTNYKNDEINPKTAVNWKILQNALDHSQGRRILILDTCHSGAAFNPRLIKDASDSSIIVFSSTDAETLAQERAALGHGVFTYALVQGIDGAADLRKDGIIKVKELDSFLSDEVERITNGEQIPVLNVPGGYKNFKFAEVN